MNTHFCTEVPSATVIDQTSSDRSLSSEFSRKSGNLLLKKHQVVENNKYLQFQGFVQNQFLSQENAPPAVMRIRTVHGTAQHRLPPIRLISQTLCRHRP